MNACGLKETVLGQHHSAVGARMGSFAGWRMPIRYLSGTIAEHRHTRTVAGLFDTCHMGEIRVLGGHAGAFLDGVLARPAADQAIGACRYNFLVNGKGGIEDDLLTYRFAPDEFLLVVNAATVEADLAWLTRGRPRDIDVVDVSDATGKLDVQGPRAADVLVDLGVPRGELPAYYRWTRTRCADVPVLLSRTGYTGELGYELYADTGAIPALWQGLVEDHRIMPIGLGARDTLRLEMGYPLFGHELGPSVTPLEAGFARLLPRHMRRLEGSGAPEGGLCKRLTAFALSGRRAARPGMVIHDRSGVLLGEVTSGAFGPSVAHAVALGYVDAGWCGTVGEAVLFGADGRPPLAGVVAAPPLYRRGTVRASVC